MEPGLYEKKQYEYRIKKPTAIISTIFVGIIFTLIGGFSTFVCTLDFIDSMRTSDYVITNATIVDKKIVDEFEEYKISYIVNNQEYIQENTFSGDDRNIGDIVSIKYDKDDPTQMAYHNDSGFVGPLFSILMLVIGIYSIISSIRNLKFFINPEKYREYAPISKMEVNDSERKEVENETYLIRTEEEIRRID